MPHEYLHRVDSHINPQSKICFCSVQLQPVCAQMTAVIKLILNDL